VKLLSFLSLFLLITGCNSELAKMRRISKRAPFITQLGSITQGYPGTNGAGEFCEDIKIDRQENIICVGTTYGLFGEVHYGNADAIIVKLNKHGELLWTFQVGTIGNDYCSGLAVDPQGNIYCGGDTTAADPLNFTHGTPGGVDAFILKLSPEGQLLWHKYFGSSGNDLCNSLTIGKSGDVYCGGNTTGSLGLLPDGSFELNGDSPSTSSDNDIFITRFDSAGNLIWIRQMGKNTPLTWIDGTSGINSGVDICNGVAVDPEERFVYCSGSTTQDFAEPNGSTSMNSFDQDVVVLRLDAETGLNPKGVQLGNHYKIAKQKDTTKIDSCRKIAVAPDGFIWCTGETYGSLGASLQGPIDAILVKIPPSMISADVKVFQFGSDQRDSSKDIAFDQKGNVLVAGSTFGSLAGATNNNPGFNEHPYVAKFRSDGARVWVSQLGDEFLGEESNGDNRCTGISVDSDNNVYCAGKVNSDVGERNGAYPSNSDDVFIWRLSPDGSIGF